MECNAEGRSDIRPKAIVEGDGAEINTRKKRNGVSKKTLLSPSHLPSRSACVCGGVCLNRHQSLGMTSTLLYVKAGAVVRGSPSALTSLSVFPPSNLFSRSVEATKKKKKNRCDAYGCTTPPGHRHPNEEKRKREQAVNTGFGGSSLWPHGVETNGRRGEVSQMPPRGVACKMDFLNLISAVFIVIVVAVGVINIVATLSFEVFERKLVLELVQNIVFDS